MNVSGGSIATDGLGCEAQTGYGCGYLDMVVPEWTVKDITR